MQRPRNGKTKWVVYAKAPFGGPEQVLTMSLTSSPDGQMIYFGAGGAIWAVPSGGGQPKKVTTGDYALMEPSGLSLIVKRLEATRQPLFRVPLGGGPEREMPIDEGSAFTAGALTSGAMNAKGQLLGWLDMPDSYNQLAVLNTAAGRVTRLAVDQDNSYNSASWTADGHIVALRFGLRATLWKFTPVPH